MDLNRLCCVKYTQMAFTYTSNQRAEFQQWKRKFDRVNCGAIGGGFTYNFVVVDGVVVDKYIDFFKGGIWRPSVRSDNNSGNEDMSFGVDESQMKRAADWITKMAHQKVTYKIIPTSIGTAFIVEADDGSKIDLSDFDDW